MSTFVKTLQVDRKDEGGYAGSAVLGVVAKSPFPPYTETTQFSSPMPFDEVTSDEFKTILGIQVTDLMETNEDLNKQLVAAGVEQDKAEQALRGAEQGAADLRTQLSGRDEQLQQLQEALADAGAQIVEATNMRNAAEKELQAAMDAAARAEDTHKKAIAAVEQRVQDAENSRRISEATLTATQAAETELRSQNAQLRLENKQLNGTLHALPEVAAVPTEGEAA